MKAWFTPIVFIVLFAVSLAGIQCGSVPPETEDPVGQGEAPFEVELSIEQHISDIRAHTKVVQAFEVIEALEPQTNQDHILITETPAPPFKEAVRAALYKDLLQESGADSVWIDEVGNVLGLRKAANPGRDTRTVAIAAHLDTVFPEGTRVEVQVRGDTLFAPGIGDDSRGLVEVLTLLRAMEQVDLRSKSDILFIGTVGEEGLGDLRGVKHLFRDNAVPIHAWIAIDGGRFGNIVHRGLGSYRYRVAYKGPGGHSWGAFGLANPHHALGEAISRFVQKADTFTESGPKTSYNIGRIGGGTSINSIPSISWMEIDLRSVDSARLNALDSLLHAALSEALDAQNVVRRSGPLLKLDVALIGNRPSGSIDKQTPIVQYAVAAAQLLGGTATFSVSSTDSNIPIAKGIPAITIGRGGKGGNAHSLMEWWIDDEGYRSIQWALLTLLAEAGIADSEEM